MARRRTDPFEDLLAVAALDARGADLVRTAWAGLGVEARLPRRRPGLDRLVARAELAEAIRRAAVAAQAPPWDEEREEWAEWIGWEHVPQWDSTGPLLLAELHTRAVLDARSVPPALSVPERRVYNALAEVGADFLGDSEVMAAYRGTAKGRTYQATSVIAKLKKRGVQTESVTEARKRGAAVPTNAKGWRLRQT
ncbi:MAG: hypothetical protein HY722_01510 [Planctomycetes bacterium]|nr:hypothetical protein [Planctomycetota bacterium]